MKLTMVRMTTCNGDVRNRHTHLGLLALRKWKPDINSIRKESKIKRKVRYSQQTNGDTA